MGSSVSKELPRHRPPLKTLDTKCSTGFCSGSKDSTSGNKSRIIYRDKILQQIPTTTTNTLIENVFLISAGSAVGEDLPEYCVQVSETAKNLDRPLLTTNNMEQAVFERLLSPNTNNVTVKSDGDVSKWKTPEGGPFDEKSVFFYLFHCFVRWKTCKNEDKYADINDDISKCKDVIFQNTKTCLRQPELFKGQHIHKQFINVCIGNKDFLFDKESNIHDFLMELFAILESERGCMMECMSPVLKYVRQQLQTKLKLTNAEEIRNYILLLRVFTLNASAAHMLMDFNAPTDWGKATCYEATLIGCILSMNTCPKTEKGQYEFFNDPIGLPWEDIAITIKLIWQRVNEICEDLYEVLIGCMRLSEDLRHSVLNWFGRCLEANRGKPDIWSAHEVEVFDTPYCSDGFCLNLCQVLLQMCEHFSEPNSQRMLKIKPSYCRAVPQTEQEMKTKCVHARGLEKEVPFVPYTDKTKLPECDVYQFVSECFFLTHQALHIGYSVVFKLLKLNSNVIRIEKLYSEIKDVYPDHIVEMVKRQLSRETCWFLNIKAALAQQDLFMRCLYFHIATASWLVQVATCDDVTEFKPVSLPLDRNVPKSLSYLPQYIITNLTQFLAPLNIFQGQDLLTENVEILRPYITLILVYMGNKDRLSSWDIRGQLAEALETILPSANEDGTWATTKSGNTEKLFNEHPLMDHLAETLLTVFVNIEITGQNVDAERKLRFRRAMHKVIHYVWQIPRHKTRIKRLSEDAVSAIGQPEPPLFLRFINLLINDAIFLLDEALDNMKQIRVLQAERDTGSWSKLSLEQFRDKESVLQGLAMVGFNRNVMANHTIYTLELLTSEIREIFCHHVMVDRIADMLNYFLEQLVGPKQDEYAVRDRKKYEFRAEQIVSDIAHIYVYLGQNDQFCKAVLGESRSFSDNLFPQAMTVLKKIGVSQEFIGKFEGLSEKLQSMESDHKHEEEAIADAPEEFIDPIMGSLMIDPVKLPTSNTNIDRAVIARHLLSDQRDPFTNLPLSMDMVTPNTELGEKIKMWKSNNIQGSV